MWSEETCNSSGGDSNEWCSAFSPSSKPEYDITSLIVDDDGYTSESDGSTNDELRFEHVESEDTDGELLLDFASLPDSKATDMILRAGRKRGLAQFTFAIAGLLIITLNIEHILNTILVLLLFAPYP